MSVGEWLVDHGCLVIFKVLFWKVHQRSGLCFVVIYEEGLLNSDKEDKGHNN